MKKIVFLLNILLCCWACEKSNPGDNGDDSGDALQFVAPEWDGVKRGDVFYEVFVRSFADKNGDGIGDLQGLTDKLDYLQELGISGIWMMPVHPSPSYHGYDVVNYNAINPEYGTMADFDALMAKAGQLNIKVVLDFVVNHTSKTHPWFVQACSSKTSPYRNFYLFAPSDSVQYYVEHNKVPSIKNYNAGEWHNVEQGTTGYKYFGAFSSWMPDINPESTALMDSLYAAAQCWLDKGVYGFRLDAAKHIYQVERSQENIDFWKAFYARLQTMQPDVYLVGEVFSDINMMAYFYQGLPYLFNFDAWEKLKWVMSNNIGKYYAKDMQDAMNAFASYNPAYVNVPKLSNHDEDRTLSVLSDNIAKAKIAAAITLTMPGQPYLYYGEEIGMLGTKSGGDENVREPFLWAPKNSDTYRTTWRTPQFNTDNKVRSLLLQKAEKQSLYNVYASFIKLRNTYSALVDGSLAYPDPASMPNELMMYTRAKDGQSLVIIHNISTGSRTYRLPADMKVEHPVMAVNGAELQQENTSYIAYLPAYSSLVIETK